MCFHIFIQNQFIMETINIKAYATNTIQIDALKAFMKALKIKFEVSKETDNPYNKGFVKKIQKGDDNLKKGKGVKKTLEDLERLCK